MKLQGHQAEKLWLVIILSSAFFIRLWHVDWGLPEVYEEAFPFSIAWKFWNWGHNGIDLNPHFFNYPAFTFYTNFLVQVAYYNVGHLVGIFSNIDAFHDAYLQNPTPFIILARLISVVFEIGRAHV